ncbi:transposase [mine drainage metagenome]|uniref:Transposase n=1 Tax=mine drainage metagenome TaxID=410659 RepID=A0A1J5QQF3_9ZZZZ
MPKAYSLEFKRRAIDLVLVDGGRPVVVASQVGVSHSCLQAWIRQAKIDQGQLPASAGLTTEELRELAVLRRENKRLKEELDIVKRAAALFARDNVLPK